MIDEEMRDTHATAGDKAERPAASVVIPTHGRRRSVLRVLEALDRQHLPGGTFEVLVVCDGDIDGTAEACEDLASSLSYPLQILRQRNQGPAAARNTGVRAARGDLIVFLDDDVVPDDRLIALHLAAHHGQNRLVTIGPLLPPKDARLSVWCAWEERVLCEQYEAMVAGRWSATYRQFYTGNAAVRRSLIVGAGGFDLSFRRAEDVELALRLKDCGAHFLFLPDARGWHYVERSFAAWLRVPGAYGAADVAMAQAGCLDVLQLAAAEFPTRRFPIRVLTQLFAGRPGAIGALTALLGGVIRTTDQRGWRQLGSHACSLLFNVCYYDGMAGALGGREALLRLLRYGEVALSGGTSSLGATVR
jgi:GT2 family glycosyltransferase